MNKFIRGNVFLSICLLISISLQAERVTHEFIEPMILQRWSPRAMSGELVSMQELMRLFEAARWAPSCFNEQPWRFIVGRKNSETWNILYEALVPFNKEWTINAGALILIISKKHFTHNSQKNPTASFDCGAAWENMALQGSSMGLVVRGMAGFDPEILRTRLNISDEYSIEAMIAVGRPGDKSSLPEYMQVDEKPSERKKVTDLVSDAFIW